MISPWKVEKAASYKQLDFKIDRIFYHVYFVQNEIECNIDCFSNVPINQFLLSTQATY